jgi:hypothetical protein
MSLLQRMLLVALLGIVLSVGITRCLAPGSIDDAAGEAYLPRGVLAAEPLG